MNKSSSKNTYYNLMKLYVKKYYIDHVVLRLLIFIEIRTALINLSNMYYDDLIFLMKRQIADKKLINIKRKQILKAKSKLKKQKSNNNNNNKPGIKKNISTDNNNNNILFDIERY